MAEGNIGAGAGSTVGKTAGSNRAMKAGVGTAAITLSNGLVVAALVAVNAVGDIIDPSTGAIVAGVRTEDGKRLADARVLMRTVRPSANAPKAGENTTIAVVATNARLTKAEASRMALMADDGLARAINPAHTPADGDTVFALATGKMAGPGRCPDHRCTRGRGTLGSDRASRHAGDRVRWSSVRARSRHCSVKIEVMQAVSEF